MKTPVLSIIAMFILLLLLTISDFDIGTFPDAPKNITYLGASQHNCLEFELPERVLDGSDGSCVAAALIMQLTMDLWDADCLLITNTGWIPTKENPVNRQWLEQLLASDGKPE